MWESRQFFSFITTSYQIVSQWKEILLVWPQPAKRVFAAEQLRFTATYSLVYRFLKQQSQNKAAEAVKKAAEPVVDLRDDIEQKGPPLEDIIQEWKTKANIKS